MPTQVCGVMTSAATTPPHPLHDHEVRKEVTGLMDDFSLMLLKKVRTAYGAEFSPRLSVQAS